MNATLHPHRPVSRLAPRRRQSARGLIGWAFALFLAAEGGAASWDPTAEDYSGREGTTLYVSKLGDNAVGLSYASYCARVQLVRCRLIVLNFTQPEMDGKSSGIICTQGHRAEGRLHVDLEDCMLAGYSVLTASKDGEAASYTTKGRVQTYVQYRQPSTFSQNGQSARTTSVFKGQTHIG